MLPVVLPDSTWLWLGRRARARGAATRIRAGSRRQRAQPEDRALLGGLVRLHRGPGLRGRQRLVMAAAVRDVARNVDCPAFPDHRHLHLAGILELVLDLPRNLV